MLSECSVATTRRARCFICPLASAPPWNFGNQNWNLSRKQPGCTVSLTLTDSLTSELAIHLICMPKILTPTMIPPEFTLSHMWHALTWKLMHLLTEPLRQNTIVHLRCPLTNPLACVLRCSFDMYVAPTWCVLYMCAQTCSDSFISHDFQLVLWQNSVQRVWVQHVVSSW